MARIRTIKPDFFKHDELFETERKSGLPISLAFIGLLTCCDRAGRFRWKPRQLKLDVLPYDEIDFELILNTLVSSGFIIKYEINHKFYGWFPSWEKHQWINNKESNSDLPAYKIDACPTRADRVKISTVSSHKEGEWEGKGNSRGIIGEKEKEGENKRENKNKNKNKKNTGDGGVIPPVILIPINTLPEYPIFEHQIKEWQGLYPKADIVQELRNIRGWNLSNPEKRKTKSGILKHINTWLSKSQNQSTYQNQDSHYSKNNCKNRSPPYFKSLHEYNNEVMDDWLNESSVEKIITGEIIDEP